MIKAGMGQVWLWLGRVRLYRKIFKIIEYIY
jgi:hypothetical protein